MRGAWVLAASVAAAMVGCGFEHGLLVHEDAAPVADAPPDVSLDAVDVHAPALCDANPALVACYAFEGNVLDASGHNLHPSTQNVAFVPGKVGMALQVGANSAADVGETPLFDVAAITIEAWIKLAQLPTAGTRVCVLDNNAQYGVFVHEGGRVQCTIVNGSSIGVEAAVAPDVWTHVACTYDGSSTKIYVNGVAVAAAIGGSAISTNGSTGISIAGDNPPGAGARLIGLIDELRILDVARSADDICSDAQCMK